MAKISVKNGKFYVDDKEFEMSGARQLSDDELEGVSGGIKIYSSGTRDNPKCEVCPRCGSDNKWTIVRAAYFDLGEFDINHMRIQCSCGYVRDTEIRIE